MTHIIHALVVTLVPGTHEKAPAHCQNKERLQEPCRMLLEPLFKDQRRRKERIYR
jgi:hypothetical protein